MKQSLFLAACASGAMSVAVSPTSSDAQTERRVRVNPGQRLEDVIHDGDNSVTLDVGGDPPLEVLPPAGTSLAEWMTHGSAVVFLVDVSSVQGRLTSYGDGIESVVSGQIVDVLKGRDDAVGKRTSFVVGGGTVEVKGVHVTATRRWANSFEDGAEYLVFGSPLADGTVQTWEGYILRISSDGTWQRMLSSDSPQVTQQLEEGDFLQDVRAAARVEK
jgi:hypothetical protein